jgi:two-component system, chemotaxis family, chemotaxis protein CheY
VLIRAIIIDDETDSAEVFAEFLKLKDIDVAGLGKNGKEGIELYKKHKPDVVFLDLVMPQYDGFYALEEIKKINADARVIIITAFLTDLMRKRLDNFGVEDVFEKPYSVKEIANTLKEKITT